MKNFNVKQFGSEVKLEEVNPHDALISVYSRSGKMSYRNIEYDLFTPLILTSIDPNIKVGQVIREDQLEPNQWQYQLYGNWYNYDGNTDMVDTNVTRQVAKLKQMANPIRAYQNAMDYNNDMLPMSHVHETPKSGHDLETCTEKEEKGTCEQKVVILKSGSVYDNRLFDSLSQARNYVAMRNPKRKWKKSNNESEMVCALYGTKFIFQPLDQHK